MFEQFRKSFREIILSGSSKFNEDFMKNYNAESDEGYFLEVDIYFLINYMDFPMIYNFYLKEW